MVFMRFGGQTQLEKSMVGRLDISGAVVIGEDHPKALFYGFGQETLSADFRPRLIGPTLDTKFEDK